MEWVTVRNVCVCVHLKRGARRARRRQLIASVSVVASTAAPVNTGAAGQLCQETDGPLTANRLGRTNNPTVKLVTPSKHE